MIGTALSIYLTAAHGLGAYNVARFLGQKAIARRRARKAERLRDEKLNAAVDYGEGLVKRFRAGELDLAKAREILDVIEQAKAYTPPAKKPVK